MDVLLDLLDAVERVNFGVNYFYYYSRPNHPQTVHHYRSRPCLVSPLELYFAFVVSQHELLLDFYHLQNYIEVSLCRLNLVDLDCRQIVVPLLPLRLLVYFFKPPVAISPLRLLDRLLVLLAEVSITFGSCGHFYFLVVFETGETLADLFGEFKLLFLHKVVYQSFDLRSFRIAGFVDFMHYESHVFAGQLLELVRVGQLEDVEHTPVRLQVESVHQSLLYDFVVKLAG